MRIEYPILKIQNFIMVVFTLIGGIVSRKSSKQIVIPRSRMEYEFIELKSLDKCGEEAEWLCHFLDDILR